MTDAELRNPLSTPATPIWIPLVGFVFGLAICWTLDNLSIENTWFSQFSLWPIWACHAMLVSVVTALVYQLWSAAAIKGDFDSRQEVDRICRLTLPEHGDVANPNQVLKCVDDLRKEAKSIHDSRFIAYLAIAILISIIGYLAFLIGLFGGPQATGAVGAELPWLLLVPLIECLVSVGLIALVSVKLRELTLHLCGLLKKQVADEYKGGALASRAKDAPAPAKHELEVPKALPSRKLEAKSSDDGLSETRSAASVDEDEPPLVFGTRRVKQSSTPRVGGANEVESVDIGESAELRPRRRRKRL